MSCGQWDHAVSGEPEPSGAIQIRRDHANLLPHSRLHVCCRALEYSNSVPHHTQDFLVALPPHRLDADFRPISARHSGESQIEERRERSGWNSRPHAWQFTGATQARV